MTLFKEYSGTECFAIISTTGLFIAYIAATIMAYIHNVLIKEMNKCLLISILPVMVCGKTLYFISSQSLPSDITKVFVNAGFVFYGGLLGFAVGVKIFSVVFKRDFTYYMNCFTIPILIAHSAGRIGCFFNGCCYGIPYSGIGAVINNGNSVFPVQIVESVMCVVLAIFILFADYNTRFYLYCTSYGILRFILEFFRGDDVRGHFLFLSTSQWISIIILSYGLLNIHKLKEISATCY